MKIQQNKIKEIKIRDDGKYDVIMTFGENGYNISEADWKEVPRWHKDGRLKTSDEFRDEQIAKNGIMHFEQNFGNCVGYNTIVDIDSKEIKIGDLFLEFNPKEEYKVLTPKGYKTFIGVQKYSKKTFNIRTETKEIETAQKHIFVVNNKEIFAYNLNIGDLLQTKTGYEEVISIEEGPEKDVYDLMSVDGEVYFTNNILSHNSFLGSSKTLISTTALKAVETAKDQDIIFNSLFEGLRIFEEPKAHHNYILASDPKQDGIDSIGLQVVDVTNIPFIQVASAKIEESFLVIPNRVFDLGTYYNNALVVQENNIEANLINILHSQLEYEGEIFKERKTSGRGFKNILGIRTTTKSKKMMTSFLKKFVEEKILIINDSRTLEEMYNFIEKRNGSFSAEEGYHDDLIMALMLIFAPFFDVKNWDDFKGFNDLIEKRKSEESQIQEETASFLSLGFSSDEDNESPFTEDLWGDSFGGMNAKEMWENDIL